MRLNLAAGILAVSLLLAYFPAEVVAKKSRHPTSKYCEWKCKLSNHFGGTGIFDSLEDLWDRRARRDECHCKDGVARGSAGRKHEHAHRNKGRDEYWKSAAEDRSKRIEALIKKERVVRADLDECRASERMKAQELRDLQLQNHECSFLTSELAEKLERVTASEAKSAQELRDLQLQNHERSLLTSELAEKLERVTASEAAAQQEAKVWFEKSQELEAALETANALAAEGHCNIDDAEPTLADEFQEQLRLVERELEDERRHVQQLEQELWVNYLGVCFKVGCATLVVLVFPLACWIHSLLQASQKQDQDLRRLRSEQKAEHEDFVKQEEFDRKLTSALDFGIYHEGKDRRAKVFCPGVEPNEITINIIFNGCEVVVARRNAPGVNEIKDWKRTIRFHPIKDGLFEFKADQATVERGILDLVFHNIDSPRVIFRFPPQHNMAVCDYDQNWDVPSDHADDGGSFGGPAVQAAGRDCRAKPMPPGGSPPSVLRTASGRLEGVADDMAGSVDRRAETSASPINSESIEEVRAQVANGAGDMLPTGRAQSVAEDFNSNASVSIVPLGNQATSVTDVPSVPDHMPAERCPSPDSDQSFVVVSEKHDSTK